MKPMSPLPAQEHAHHNRRKNYNPRAAQQGKLPSYIPLPPAEPERLLPAPSHLSYADVPQTDEGRGNLRALQLAVRQQVLRLYAQGKTPQLIALEVGLPIVRVEREINRGVDSLVRFYAEPRAEHSFVRYAAFQTGIIAKLQATYDRLARSDDPKVVPTAVHALRAQSDIYDRIMDRGLQLKVISSTLRTASTSALHKAPEDIRHELKRQITTLSVLLERVEEADPNLQPLRTRGPSKPSRFRKVRKVRRSPMGIVYATNDWKYPTTSHKGKLLTAAERLAYQPLSINPLDPHRPYSPHARVKLSVRMKRIEEVSQRSYKTRSTRK